MKTDQKYILVIDDDPDILDAVQFMLEDEGFTVKTSQKGDFIEQLLRTNHSLPKLIILDVLLSGNDGRTITKKLKSQKVTKSIPVIMISAHPNVEQSIRACGADDFLPKPFDVHLLLQKINKYIAVN